MAATSKSLVGTRMGKYALRRLLGRGAFGEVYVGVPRSGPEVAIKVLDAALTHERSVVVRFEREAATAKKLEHPGIVRILDVGAQRGRHYIVMELVRGGSFRRFLRKDGAAEKVVGILTDVAQALAYAHAQGVVHRDVKPENILLTKSRRARVADFGLARAADNSTMTTDGHMLGTAMYMSPEHASGGRATPASDVYAVGLMIYEAISGTRPFSSETTYGLIYQHVSYVPPRPRVKKPYAPALATLALRCLAKDPAERPTMAEVAARLEESALVRPVSGLRVGAIAAAVVTALFLALVVHPPLASPLCGDWFGAAPFRVLRSTAAAIHEAVVGR